jgi:hypothetical protein
MEHYKGTPYKMALFEDKMVSDVLTIKELEIALDPSNYIGVSRERIENVIEIVRSPEDG